MMLLLSLLACGSPSRDAFDVGGEMVGLALSVENGSVRIVGSDRSDVHIERRMEGPVEGRPTLEDGLLSIELGCTSLLPCRSDVDIEIPALLPVDLDVAEGDVRLVNLHGDLNAEIQSGNLDATELAMPVFRGTLGLGDAMVRFDAAPSGVYLGAGMGNVRLSLPPGRYHLDLAGAGGATVEGVSNDEKAPDVQVHTASGRVTVRAEGMGGAPASIAADLGAVAWAK